MQEEAKLEEIVKLVGINAISSTDRMKMEAAKCIREDFLHQNAFHKVDTYTSLKKQFLMMSLILQYFDLATEVISGGATIREIVSIPVKEQIGRFKYFSDDEIDKKYKEISTQIEIEIGKLAKGGDE